MLILIAGPYRSGTNDDPQLMRKNLSRLESVALPLFRLGHLLQRARTKTCGSPGTEGSKSITT
jgi:hypothetical protein